MADAFLFARHGWKSIWKQKSIWLFSLLPIFTQVSNIFQAKRPTDLFASFVSLAMGLVFIFLFYVSFIGTPYLAYRFLIGKPATIQETLSAVKKFAGRVTGCSCLGFLAISPLLFWALVVSINRSTRALEFSNTTIAAFLSLSIFTALWQFALVAFFENDWGIRQSLDKAWNLYKSHFGVLALLGLILMIVFKAYSAMSGALTVLIQSGFDITSMNNLNIFNPAASLSENWLFVLMTPLQKGKRFTLAQSAKI